MRRRDLAFCFPLFTRLTFLRIMIGRTTPPCPSRWRPARPRGRADYLVPHPGVTWGGLLLWSLDCDIRAFSEEPQRHEIVKISLIILLLSVRLRYCGGVRYVCECNLQKREKKREQQPRRASNGEKLESSDWMWPLVLCHSKLIRRASQESPDLQADLGVKAAD